MMRPAAFVVTALLSTWVFASSERKRLPLLLTTAWTLGTFLFPFVILPLYLVLRIAIRSPIRAEEVAEDGEANSEADKGDSVEGDPVEIGAVGTDSVEADSTDAKPATDARPEPGPRGLRRFLPAAYLMLLLAFGAVSYVRDYRSFDAHLSRATNARLVNDRARVVSEYRAALGLQDDPHTHLLLALELEDAHRLDEALAEFRAAERGGEPNPTVTLHTGTILDRLDRHDEATEEFRKFLSGPLCTQTPPDPLCAGIETRVRSEPARAN